MRFVVRGVDNFPTNFDIVFLGLFVLDLSRDASPSDRCWSISRERKVPETPKLVGRVSTTRQCASVSRWKVKVTRSTNAETGSANGKAYELVRRPVSSTCAVTNKVEGQGLKVTWCVWHLLADKSRTKRPRNTKIGRKVVHRMGNNAHQFKG